MRLLWHERPIGNMMVRTAVTENEVRRLKSLISIDRSDVLEVGTAFGYTACEMASTARSVLTVDTYHGYGHTGVTTDDVMDLARALGLEDRVLPLVGDSAKVLPFLHRVGARFDLVFIDGDHRRMQVEFDIAMGWALLRSGGTLAVHDYGEDVWTDVKAAVDDLARRLAHDGVASAHIEDTLWTLVKP